MPSFVGVPLKVCGVAFGYKLDKDGAAFLTAHLVATAAVCNAEEIGVLLVEIYASVGPYKPACGRCRAITCNICRTATDAAINGVLVASPAGVGLPNDGDGIAVIRHRDLAKI